MQMAHEATRDYAFLGTGSFMHAGVNLEMSLDVAENRVMRPWELLIIVHRHLSGK